MKGLVSTIDIRGLPITGFDSKDFTSTGTLSLTIKSTSAFDFVLQYFNGRLFLILQVTRGAGNRSTHL